MYECIHVRVHLRTAVVDGHWWCLPSLQSTFLWYQLWGPCTPPLHAVSMGISIWVEWHNIENSWIWLIFWWFWGDRPLFSQPYPGFHPSWDLAAHLALPFDVLPHFLQKQLKIIFFPKFSQKHFVAFNQIIQTNMMLLLGCHRGGNEYGTWEGKRDSSRCKTKKKKNEGNHNSTMT